VRGVRILAVRARPGSRLTPWRATGMPGRW